ncbi:tRNA 2-selenouridine(34) synthase MnmH [Curvibacter sp. HBC61]|uniref:tRNA 2-selenouridine(34) synthase MnmH n=1 Tax=Curvibacter cyanobacteriorum TaxID=3026422 RepID=A0ABT5MYZ5_9BURK|nr:tRNA 2-selenouridine(34) synthase MnmH [Curvibacter sp. HBC61]MDD0838646.1 tRNA 2-selenouridine(34) synthase MnmH [Curvibacter sp. HBC61]
MTAWRGPVPITERHQFDTLIDARSPAEFALDHVPGAINCPALDDEERRTVGTLYKQQGAFEARRVGGALVAANLARHLREHFADRPADWKPLVYCWRGGLRSGSMVAWLRLVGWDAQQVAGGYKRWRQHVIDTLASHSPTLRWQVLAGATGTAKTRLLQALAREGAQVLDLEQLARHKGSLLGAWPGQPQPSQKAFETALAVAIEGFDPARPVWIEAESRKIGQLSVPNPLLAALRAAPCLELTAPKAARLAFLLQDYAYLAEHGEALAQQLAPLRTLHGHDTLLQWQDWARLAQLPPLFEQLITRHYDPQYARSQAAHLHGWSARQTLPLAQLDPETLSQVARQLKDRVLDAPPAAQKGR